MQEIRKRGRVGRQRVAILAGAGVPGERTGLDAYRLQQMKEPTREGRCVEVVEEHGQVRLAMRLGPFACTEVGNQDPGPGNVEVERAELLEAELQEHFQTVGTRVPVVFFEEIDGLGQDTLLRSATSSSPIFR